MIIGEFNRSFHSHYQNLLNDADMKSHQPIQIKTKIRNLIRFHNLSKG